MSKLREVFRMSCTEDRKHEILISVDFLDAFTSESLLSKLLLPGLVSFVKSSSSK